MTGCGNSSNGTNAAASTTTNQNGVQETYLAYSPTNFTNDQLWKSDGTTTNTGQVSTVMSAGSIIQDQSLQIQEVYQVGNYLYSWVRYSDDTGNSLFPSGYNKLYQTDITNSYNTTLVSGVYKDLSDSLFVFGGLKHFTASNGNTYIFNREGTDNMKTKLTRINNDGSTTDIAQPTGYYLYPILCSYFQDGDILYVEAGSTTDTKLFSIDLSSNNPTWTAVPQYGTHTGYATSDLYKVNDKLYTFSYDGTAYHLSSTDLTSAQTDIATIGSNYEPAWKTSLLNEHPYAIDNTSLYIAMHKTDTGEKGLFRVDTNNNINFLGGSYTDMGQCYEIFSFQGEIYYLGEALSGGLNLYKYSNSGSTTTLVTTIPQSISNTEFILNSAYITSTKLYYAKSDSRGLELWSYDGTTERFEVDINPGSGNSRPTRIIELNGKIILQASQDGTNNKLLSWDGTTLTPLN